MKRHMFLSCVILLVLAPVCFAQTQQALPLPIEVHFSPKGGCTEAVVKEINAAKKTIFVQAYSFTSAPIAKALVDSYQRAVDVRVILDKSQRTEKYSSADFLQNARVPTWIDTKHAIAHNKVMVIDGETVITGSFNFTKAAEENNAENLLIIKDKALADKYTGNWDVHVEHSDKYEGKEQGYSETHETKEEVAPDSAPKTADTVGVAFVASATSQVFHRPDCESAAKISKKNLMTYSTRNEAIQAGRKPCEECNP